MNKKDEALDYIANYILPIYPINGEKYVKLDVALLLKNKAREALEKHADSSKTR